MMTPKECVLAAFAFRQPDRIPRFDYFLDFPEEWTRAFGAVEELSDIRLWTPDEGAFPSRAKLLREEDGWIYRVDSWGRTLREKPGTYFVETLQVAIPEDVDPDSVLFDPPDLDLRFSRAVSEGFEGKGGPTHPQVEADRTCVFGKTGGPYLRTTFLRGEEQFLMDIAGDPPLARALADKMADHLIGVAREQIRRWPLHDTGIEINDDIAGNRGPVFSPKSFETIFLPAYRRMVREYKAAGASYVMFHSDGNIMPLLDMLVDAGIDAINPMERRAGMDASAIRERYPRLVLTGGMCNTDTLVNGPVERIERETRELIDLGRDGGLVIGSHSIGPEVPLDHFRAYDRTCRTYGNFR